MQSAGNSNVSSMPRPYPSRPVYEKVLLLQFLVGIFLSVNCLLIFTFLKKRTFREETRYILFAQTLFNDSVLMVISDLSAVGSYYQVQIHILLCCALCVFMKCIHICTPLTLAAMSLERYVAICMPLRHASISTTRTRGIGLLLIWVISSVPAFVIIVIFLSIAPRDLLMSNTVCSIEVLYIISWMDDVVTAMHFGFFLSILVIIVFTYFQIMKAARAASSDNNSSRKSLRTVVLHAIQLFLCTAFFVTPYIESVVLRIDLFLFINVRYSNFIVFLILPRCLSPLIYGLRDEKVFSVLKHYFLCRHVKTSPF